ncbi:MAG: acyltransferase family protein [Burkholderiaceae bacterium]
MNIRSSSPRSVGIDALKVLASQCIVLHHLSIYGPMPGLASPMAPGLFQWLDAYGRYAVQVFLVIGGYLAASSLSSQAAGQWIARSSALDLCKRILKRYWRLAPSLWVALGLALLVTALLRFGLGPDHTPDHTPEWPSAWHVLAQMLMVQDVLDIPALSAGIWYVAIDLQLQAMLLLLLWLLHRTGRGSLVDPMVFAMTALSLLVINRDTAWEIWAPYFFGAYGLGVLAWRSTQETGARKVLLLLGMTTLVGLALWIDWRDRIALAALIALGLIVIDLRSKKQRANQSSSASSAWITRLGSSSYSLFLVHYPVCLAMNGLATFMPPSPALHASLLLATWILSNLAGELLYTRVENRVSASSRDPGAPSRSRAGY